jgi:hypothetical protein
VEGVGGEPFALFRFPEKLILVSFINVEEKSVPGKEQFNAHVRVSIFDFAERIPFILFEGRTT